MSDEPEHAQPDLPATGGGASVRIVFVDEHLLTVDGVDRVVPPGGDIEDEAEAAAAEAARARGGPVDAVLSSPDGAWRWRLRAHPDGRVEELADPVVPRRRRRWPWGVLAVLVLAAAVLTFTHWPSSSPEPVTTPLVATGPAAVPVVPVPPAACAPTTRATPKPRHHPTPTPLPSEADGAAELYA